MIRRFCKMIVPLMMLFILMGVAVNAQTKLLRFPDIHEDKVVFCYAGDLWLVNAAGGAAIRLTAHPGLEIFPKFSPDGRWIAFTGQYDGDEQVYVIPADGGIPKQLTYFPARGPLPPRWGYDNQVYGWTNNSKQVLFRSLRNGWDLSDSRLFTTPLDGGLPVALPMPVSGAGDFSPDGSRVVYSPLFRDFRTWKRYQGGWAQDLFIFDLKTHDSENITRHPRSDRDPMWMGDAVYFSSDRDGTLNLYKYDPETRQTSQLTKSAKWDVRWPSADAQGQIIYELNGRLQIYDTRTGADKPISVQVHNDGVAMRPARISAAKNIEGFGLSPKGERALFVARGDVFTVPIKKGHARNLTKSSNAHDKRASWSPDGRKIAYISDETGEEEIWLANQDGSGKPEQLTTGGNAMRYALEWSPDGTRLAFSDKNGCLYLLTIEDKKVVEVARDKGGNIRDYSWSPDSAYLAFSLSNPIRYRSIYIWSVKDATLHRVTGDFFNDRQPVWDPEGKYLFFLSNHEFTPQISLVEWNFAGNRMTGIFALALNKEVKNPFAPESDEVTIDSKKKKDDNNKEATDKKKTEETGKTEKDKKADKDKKAKKDEKKPVKIDFEGLGDRISRVPVPGENYYGLAAVKGHLLFVRAGAPFYGRRPAMKMELHLFSMKDRKDNVFVKDVAAYVVSADGKKALVRQGRAYNLYNIPSKGKTKKTVSTSELMVDRVPVQEWRQIFDEVWRRYRDFFYVENMHGYDWDAVREQYLPLLEHVAHRSDLNYVIGEMIAELNVGHAYIQGGDFEIPKRPRVALPGARFELDQETGLYRIAMIFQGQNEESRYRSPLTEIGMDAKVGDYVLAIDGEELKAPDNPYRLLWHKGNRPVTLTLNSTPEMKDARKVTFNPITSETSLVYLKWVNKNKKKVDKATGGRVGYFHIPDMGVQGGREFIKWFYPQIRKEGLVVDVRGNGGGNISAWIIERLRRPLLGTGFSRNSEYTGTYPSGMHVGPKVCILNETSASDGDIFPYMFREAGIGPLIGKRSWGGVVGITGHGSLIDGAVVYVPEFGMGGADGQWVVEGEGVSPDIEVENDPKSVLEGKDPQLERAVEEVLRRLKEKPVKLPSKPESPVKTGRLYKAKEATNK